jgi:two-component system, cell cycle sensor histidine kinase and response regulator CckA
MAELHARPHALLAVTDTGLGMDAETTARIFEPFFTTKGDAGTGLGLATVHGIVMQSGGQIVVYSEPGHETTFKIYLPLSAGGVAAPKPPAPFADGGTETVLVVEDDPAVRSIVRTMLEARGYDVLAAEGGDEALAAIEQHDGRVALVLSDLIMRGLNGRQTVDRIRETQPDTKVLYMSGYTDDTVIRSGALEPGTAFIQKPFSGDDLARRVRELLDRQPA